MLSLEETMKGLTENEAYCNNYFSKLTPLHGSNSIMPSYFENTTYYTCWLESDEYGKMMDNRNKR